MHAEEKWPCEHTGNVSLCNICEEDEITSTPRVSLDRDHSVSV